MCQGRTLLEPKWYMQWLRGALGRLKWRIVLSKQDCFQNHIPVVLMPVEIHSKISNASATVSSSPAKVGTPQNCVRTEVKRSFINLKTVLFTINF